MDGPMTSYDHGPRQNLSRHQTEVIIKHAESGHIYHFPILSNGTVSLQGSRNEANPKAAGGASRYLFGALHAAQAALSRSHV
jgi:hypothetical protein